MTTTLRDSVIGRAAAKTEIVTLEDGLVVEVRSLTMTERGNLLNDAVSVNEDEESTTTDNTKLQVMLVIASVCDPTTHTPIFAAADYDMVAGFDAGFFTEAIKVAQRLSGLGRAAAKVAEKNSAETTV
jgi:hypothetical protein